MKSGEVWDVQKGDGGVSEKVWEDVGADGGAVWVCAEVAVEVEGEPQ